MPQDLSDYEEETGIVKGSEGPAAAVSFCRYMSDLRGRRSSPGEAVAGAAAAAGRSAAW